MSAPKRSAERTIRAAGAILVAVMAGGGMLLPVTAAPAPAVAVPFLPGGNAHAPINIDAAKLDYFDKEQKLVYSGGVTARQGDTVLKASSVVIYLDRSATPAGDGPVPAANAQISHMDVIGPVTVLQKDQVGMGDNGSYEKADNKVYLVGHVSLSQGPNIVRGDKLTYDLTTGNADVQGQHVISIFTPGAGGIDPTQHPAAPKKGH